MRAIFIGAVIFCVLSLGSVPHATSAVAPDPWLIEPIVKTAEIPVGSSPEGEWCGSTRGLVEIASEAGLKAACLYGVTPGIRVAAYSYDSGMRYAISFPGDTRFYEVKGLCRTFAECFYAQDADTLFMKGEDGALSAIKNVSTQLERSSGLTVTYSLGVNAEEVALYRGDVPLKVTTAVVSKGGQWLAVLVPDRGYVRIRTSTFEHVRVGAYDSIPRQLVNGAIHIALSEDGKLIAATGYTLGVLLYEVDDTCGDKLSSTSSPYFSDGALTCNSRIISMHEYSSPVLSVGAPAFSPNGQSFSITVVSPDRTVRLSFGRATHTDPRVLYRALGDSFTSGEGEVSDTFYLPGTNSATNRCHVSSRSYPYLLGSRLSRPVANGACSGSRIPGMQAALRTAVQSPGLISLGIGGNDVDLIGKLKICINMGSCEWVEPSRRRAMAQEIQALFPKLVDVINEVKQSYPDAPLFIVGYPSIINDRPAAACSPLIGTLLNDTERRFIGETIHYLNAILKAAAYYQNVPFADIEHAFDGERLCDSSERAMNGIRGGGDIAPINALSNLKVIGAESFHPTPTGHERSAGVIEDQLRGFIAGQTCGACVYTEALLEFPTYWKEGAFADSLSFKQLSALFLLPQETMDSEVMFGFPPRTFAAGTTVRFELHSQVHDLGSVIVESDGSISGHLTMPEGVEGYHTIHALGESPSGERLDLYQTVYIEGGAVSIADGATTEEGPPRRDSHEIQATEAVYGVYRSRLNQSVAGAERTASLAGASKNAGIFWLGIIVSLVALVVGSLLWVKNHHRKRRHRYNGTMSMRSIVKAVIPTTLFKRIEPTGHLLESMVMVAKHGFPARNLRVIGVTGTNGKTTTTFFIQKMLSEAGIKTGLTSTVAYGVDSDITRQIEHMTTTSANVLQSRLKKFAAQGAEWVVIEASSHALAQNRTWGIPFEVAVLTNLTHDHLEYHGTFDNYREAKRKLFRIANKHGLRYGVVNAEDPSAKVFADTVANSTTYGIKQGDIHAVNVKLTDTGSTYTAVAGDDTYDIAINIPGEFNVYNSLAALSVGRKLGLTKEQIEKGLAALQSVEGRMNAIDEGQTFKVLVDFASTPDGFEKFFSSVRPLVKGRLIAVFGSAGRRDESKRAEQGRIAGTYADVVIATEEDDRDDDGAKILRQIAEGATESGKKQGKTLFTIANREEAIGFAFTQASEAEDMVVLLGKGHENTIERADGPYPWNESNVARAALQELLKK
jgi:UDP-N-acetylmuramoyl-L-alanyl-D-glutamate--2,6-diaminopimelate ligase